jgi:hypothetical protein
MVYSEQIKVLSTFLSTLKKELSEIVNEKEIKIKGLEERAASQKMSIRDLEEKNHQLNRELTNANSKLVELEQVKDMEIGYLKQKESNNSN